MQQIRVEVIKRESCNITNDEIIERCEKFFNSNIIISGTIINELNQPLAEDIHCIIIEEFKTQGVVILNKFKINWFIYALHDIVPQPEFSDDDEESMLYTHTIIPSVEFHGLWESLTYDTDIKENLLSYASTMMTFSEKGVSPNLIYSNRVVLLHGPPGTGKTSLCKALAHKLSIRLKDRYSYCQLIEINSHNLFSKWFSESGKLVTKLFTYLCNGLEDERMLICVLVDEIETLALARTSCMTGNDPTDSVRVVNALLTQLDKIRKFPNVLLLTTSNMSTGIDLALVDRADITQYVGLPRTPAIYSIYHSCIQELMRVGVIYPTQELLPSSAMNTTDNEQVRHCELSKQLMDLSASSHGLSGRVLRKIPVTAHSYFLDSQATSSLFKFLQAMSSAVEFHKKQSDFFKPSAK